MTVACRGADILVGGRLLLRAPTALRDKNVAPPGGGAVRLSRRRGEKGERHRSR